MKFMAFERRVTLTLILLVAYPYKYRSPTAGGSPLGMELLASGVHLVSSFANFTPLKSF